MRRRDRPMPFAVHDDTHGFRDVLVIIQRLAHAHQHDRAEQARRLALRAGPLGVAVARGHELADDFRRTQVAHQGLRSGMAEPAGEGAADLAADAHGTAILRRVGDVHGLGFLTVAEAEQELAGVVGAGLHRGGDGAADHETLGELRLQRLGDRAHQREIGGALVVDPVPELFHAERLFADRRDLGGQLLARKADQVPPPVRQHVRRRVEQSGFGEDAGALGLGEVRAGHLADERRLGGQGVHAGQAFAMAAKASPKPFRLK